MTFPELRLSEAQEVACVLRGWRFASPADGTSALAWDAQEEALLVLPLPAFAAIAQQAGDSAGLREALERLRRRAE